MQKTGSAASGTRSYIGPATFLGPRTKNFRAKSAKARRMRAACHWVNLGSDTSASKGWTAGLLARRQLADLAQASTRMALPRGFATPPPTCTPSATGSIFQVMTITAHAFGRATSFGTARERSGWDKPDKDSVTRSRQRLQHRRHSVMSTCIPGSQSRLAARF